MDGSEPAVKIDKLLTSNKFAAWLFRQRVIAVFGTTSAENMAFPAAAAIASGFICRNFAGEIYWLESVCVTVMLLAWVLSSLLAGFMKRWHFLIFSAGFNLLPHLFMNRQEGVSDMSVFLAEASRFIAVYSSEPMVTALSQTGITPFILSAFITGGSGALMLAGFFIRKNARSSREYCKVRLSMLGN